MTLRVLLISHTCQSEVEGQPKAALLASRFGTDLQVLVPHRWKHYGQWRVPHVPTAPPYRLTVGRAALSWVGPAQCYLHFYPGLARILRQFRPHIIDLWEEPWGLVSAHACGLRNRLLPAARIISETEQNIDKHLPFPFEAFRRYTFRHADFLVGRNQEAVRIARAKGYAGPASVVPNAVGTGTFAPMDVRACRDRFRTSGFVAGYAGRLVPEKGLDDLLDAIPLCPPHVSVHIAGTGPYESHLRQRARSLGLEDRVVFHGNLPAADLAAFLNACDVFVLPSRTTARWKEQFGRVIIEAFACRVPVIGSSSGAIPEVIGDDSLIFSESDPVSLASRLCELIEDPARREKCASAGYQRAHAHFTWERVAQRMADIYRSLVDQPEARCDPLAHPASSGNRVPA